MFQENSSRKLRSFVLSSAGVRLLARSCGRAFVRSFVIETSLLCWGKSISMSTFVLLVWRAFVRSFVIESSFLRWGKSISMSTFVLLVWARVRPSACWLVRSFRFVCSQTVNRSSKQPTRHSVIIEY